MLLLIINIFFLLILGLCIISIININKYNNNSKLIELDKMDNLNNKRILDPILFSVNNDIDITNNIIYDNPKKYYEVDGELIRLEDFKNNKDINIINNKKLIEDFEIKDYSDNLYKLFSNNLSFNKLYNCSLIQTDLDIQINKKNLLLINTIFGDIDILLINPKHKENIDKNKNINEYKKISIIVKLIKGKTLYIPTNWYYIILVNELSFILNINSDTYLTYLYNIYK